ncbi:MAG TPA: hypothetical protein VF548_05025 [Allosphingosinicella sp.]|jgi:hypothetical protein
MRFPNEIQAALLFDRRVGDLEAAVRTFLRVEEARTGARFAVPESRPGSFYRLFGGGEMTITLEYVDGPASLDVFGQALSSAVTHILCPEARTLLTRNRSHILVNVSHGVLGNSPEIARMMAQLGRPMEGHSLPEFVRRLEICALVARIVGDHSAPQIVHWCQSNQLFPGEAFDALAAMPAPSPLHVHPYLFGKPALPGGEASVGIRTFGVRHFIGREVLIEPSVLPWAANLETILAFLRIATAKNGYVIPDGDTFGPEDRSQSYRVVHCEAEEGDVALYRLEPLLHREFGFVAQEYVPPERVFDDRMPPPDLMPGDDEAKMELVNEWREKRALAAGVGGRFEVRARDPRGDSPPPARPAGFGGRPVFGRKKA